MKGIPWLILSLTLVLSAGLAAPVAARPAPTICTSALAGLTISSDLVVPASTDCALDHVTVLGDIHVRERATFGAHNSRIAGSLAGSGFERVTLRDSIVGGQLRLTGGARVELERTTAKRDAQLIDQIDARVLQSRLAGDLVVRGSREVALLCGTTVEGDARFAEHRGGLLIGDDPTFPGFCSANEVRGNLRVHHNQSDTIVANTSVGQNLVCAANDPAPAVYGNQVGGKARGQCGMDETVSIAELDDGEK